MLGWLVRSIFSYNFSPWSRVFIRIVRRLRIIVVYIGHCQRIIGVNSPIIHGSLFVLDVVLNFALLIIWSIFPWNLHIVFGRWLWILLSMRFFLDLHIMGLYHVPSLVDMLDVLIIVGMPRFRTRRPVASLILWLIYILFWLHFYTLLWTLLFHRFIVDRLHKIFDGDFNYLIRPIVTRLEQVFIEIKISVRFSAGRYFLI